mmetsp:Transcript_831/g.2077  ORF Transcript_831/g.2077 Transcript_831/m.2077 type:complete len:261 (-) Transcript_831:204-986(-)
MAPGHDELREAAARLIWRATFIDGVSDQQGQGAVLRSRSAPATTGNSGTWEIFQAERLYVDALWSRAQELRRQRLRHTTTVKSLAAKDLIDFKSQAFRRLSDAGRPEFFGDEVSSTTDFEGPWRAPGTRMGRGCRRSRNLARMSRKPLSGSEQSDHKSWSSRRSRVARELRTGPMPETTVMLRNLPDHLRREHLETELKEAGLAGRCNFLHVPDVQARPEYAILNFLKVEDAHHCRRHFTGFIFDKLGSSKVCSAETARF